MGGAKAGLLLFAGILAGRLCHLDVLWVEECYPAAAAIQILDGKLPYADFWFDKPPLSAWVYLLWGAYGGLPLRLAGTVFVGLVCWLAHRFGGWSAVLVAFYLTFGVPSAVMAMAPDLLMLAPHLGAVYLAWRGRAFWSGVVAGVAMLVHTKGLFVLAACLLWCWRDWHLLGIGFVLPQLVLLPWIGPYWQQVWAWGFVYSRDTFVQAPVWEGVRRTLNWAGMHATLIAGAAWYFWKGRDGDRWKLAAWGLLALAGIAAGWRFFPRYYFLLLPVMVIAGSRGLAMLQGRWRVAALALLLIPLARFGPRYGLLAWDLIRGKESTWADLAMYQGSREAARVVQSQAQPGNTLLIWGYRPDIFVETRLPIGTPYLDSQPLTGVIADRHLVDSRPSTPELAAVNRSQLIKTEPTFIVDGLGPYNSALAITSYPDLKDWLGQYQAVAHLSTAVVYKRAEEQAVPPTPR